MLARLLLAPFLVVWLMAGVCAVVILALLVYVRRMEQEERLPYKASPPRTAGLKSHTRRLR